MSFLKFVCIGSYVGSLLSLSGSIGAMVKQAQVVPAEAGEPVLAGMLMAETPELPPLEISERDQAVRYRSVMRSPNFRHPRPAQIIVPLRPPRDVRQALRQGDRPNQTLTDPASLSLSLSHLHVRLVEQVDPLIKPVADWSKPLPQRLPSQPPVAEAKPAAASAEQPQPRPPHSQNKFPLGSSLACYDGPTPPVANAQKPMGDLVETDHTLRGIASWYGPYFHGRQTASGEAFDQEAMTAAHPTLPFGTLLKVTNLKNRRMVVVRINDRGPYIGRRSLDLSRRAAQCLGSLTVGIVPYQATVLEKAPQSVSLQTQ